MTTFLDNLFLILVIFLFKRYSVFTEKGICNDMNKNISGLSGFANEKDLWMCQIVASSDLCTKLNYW